MRKIPTILRRDDSGKVIPQITPGTEWVFDHGRPTVKLDGTSVCIEDGWVYKRCTVKPDGGAPENFVPVDEFNGKILGWVPCIDGDPRDQYHIEGFKALLEDVRLAAGVDVEKARELVSGRTYELVGPKFQSNPHRLSAHRLVRHGIESPVGYASHIGRITDNSAALWEAFLDIMVDVHWEGIVWWHRDGRRAKLKRTDMGLDWPFPILPQINERTRALHGVNEFKPQKGKAR